jgi:hypothetical protein
MGLAMFDYAGEQDIYFENGAVPHGSAGVGVRRSHLHEGRLLWYQSATVQQKLETRVLRCMEKTRYPRDRA